MENHLPFVPFVPRAVGRKLHLHLPAILGDRKGIPISRSSTSAVCQRIDSQRLIVDEFRRTAFIERIGNGHIKQRPSFAEGFPSRLSTLTVCSPPAADSDNSVDRTSYSSFRDREPSQPGKNKSAHITLATIVETDFIISN